MLFWLSELEVHESEGAQEDIDKRTSVVGASETENVDTTIKETRFFRCQSG